MKKVVFIALCAVGFFGFTSCGSTAPCGLSQAKEKQQLKEIKPATSLTVIS